MSVGCTPTPKQDVSYLIDGPQNTFAMLRGINTTSSYAYAEFRPITSPPLASATNWTELYDMTHDYWQADNLALSLPKTQIEAYSTLLWSVATCAGAECP
jgi:hypothetical protein